MARQHQTLPGCILGLGQWIPAAPAQTAPQVLGKRQSRAGSLEGRAPVGKEGGGCGVSGAGLRQVPGRGAQAAGPRGTREGAPKAGAEVGKVWVPAGQGSPEEQCC